LLTTAPPDDDDDDDLARKLSAEHPISAMILIATLPIAAALHNVMKDTGTKVTFRRRGRRCDGSFLGLEDIVPPDKYD